MIRVGFTYFSSRPLCHSGSYVYTNRLVKRHTDTKRKSDLKGEEEEGNPLVDFPG